MIPQTEPKPIAYLVIWLVGVFAVVGLIGILIFLSLAAIKKEDISVTTVALLSTLSTLVGTALGILGSVLNQTSRPVNPPGSQPVHVDNTTASPVPTQPQP